jgi:hypothetical protein
MESDRNEVQNVTGAAETRNGKATEGEDLREPKVQP